MSPRHVGCFVMVWVGEGEVEEGEGEDQVDEGEDQVEEEEKGGDS